VWVTLAVSFALMLGAIFDRSLTVLMGLMGLGLLVVSAVLLVWSTPRPTARQPAGEAHPIPHREMAQQILASARQAESSGKTDFALAEYVAAGQWFIASAIKEHPDVDSGVAYLREIGFVELMADSLQKWEVYLPQAIAPGKPAPNMHPQWHDLAYACWLLSEDELAHRWVAIASMPATLEMVGRSMRTCTAAVCAFANRQQYSFPEIRSALGWERYCLRYASLIAAITNGQSVEEQIKQIDSAFSRRNRTENDYGVTVGDKRSPAAWDFRKAAILMFAERRGPA